MENFIVYVIVGLSVLYLIRFVVKKFTGNKDNSDKCITCRGCPFLDSCHDEKKGTYE
ncbi:MAG: FeoB-associated Cys-rich membrane protein [Spirochaetes bacterium]|nr:FeoB-associated Cys-rich membrane protein [Spirochaetota bacterium]